MRVSLPSPARNCGRGSADDRGAHKDEIGLLIGLHDLAGKVASMLFGRIGLPRQQRLIDKEVARFDQPAVGRDDIAGAEIYDIARHQLFEMQLALASVAEHQRLWCHGAAQRIDGVVRVKLLDEIERHAQRDDDDDDEEACRVAGKRRQRARKQQDENGLKNRRRN